MEYTVKYKHPTWWFWRKLRHVIGDGFVYSKYMQETRQYFISDNQRNAVSARECVIGPLGSRYFHLADHTVMELPDTMLFVFSKKRHEDREKKIENEKAGHVTG